MLLTIVVPIYNVKEYLQECLDSLPGKGCSIILVNDGSTDGSELMCERYAAGRKDVLVVNKRNGGLSDARNAALPYIASEYVFFLDSDDFIDGDELMSALKFAKDNRLDWVQCGYVYRYDGYDLLPKRYAGALEVTKAEVLRQLVDNGYIKNFAWGKIYRTSVVKNFFFPKGKFFEDVMWQYYVVESCRRFGIYANIVTYYRQRTGSISNKFSIRNYDLLEGMYSRLQAVESDHPEIFASALLNMWSTSSAFLAMGRKFLDREQTSDFEELHNAITSTYGLQIKQFMRNLSLFKRLRYMPAIYSDNFTARVFGLITRVIKRLEPDEYLKVRHEC